MLVSNEDARAAQGARARYSPEQYAEAIAASRQANLGVLQREYDQAVQEQNAANQQYQQTLGDLVRTYSPPETQAQREKREKNDRARRNIAFAADVIRGIGSMIAARNGGGATSSDVILTDAVEQGVNAREARERQRRSDYSTAVTNYQKARKESADKAERNAYNAVRQAQQNQLSYDRIASAAAENEKRRNATAEEKEKDRILKSNVEADKLAAKENADRLKASNSSSRDSRDEMKARAAAARDVFNKTIASLNARLKSRSISQDDYNELTQQATQEYNDAVERAISGETAEPSTSNGTKGKRSFLGKANTKTKDY